MPKTQKIGIGISPKTDWDAILLGLVCGAFALPHVPFINTYVNKANRFITSKVGF